MPLFWYAPVNSSAAAWLLSMRHYQAQIINHDKQSGGRSTEPAVDTIFPLLFAICMSACVWGSVCAGVMLYVFVFS